MTCDSTLYAKFEVSLEKIVLRSESGVRQQRPDSGLPVTTGKAHQVALSEASTHRSPGVFRRKHERGMSYPTPTLLPDDQYDQYSGLRPQEWHFPASESLRISGRHRDLN